MPPFSGFSKQTIKFLKDLEKNNNKAWFDANRDIYQEHYVAEAKAFVVAMGERLKTVSKGIKAEPAVNKSIMRINRDIRFSKDKRPYKTHMDLWFWQGENKGWDQSGFFFRMSGGSILLGTGMHEFTKPMLTAFRTAVAGKKGDNLAKAVAGISRTKGANISDPEYKKVPKGYDAEHKRAELLRHKGITAGIELPLPKEVHSAKFVTFCLERFKKVAPLHVWLSGVAKAIK